MFKPNRYIHLVIVNLKAFRPIEWLTLASVIAELSNEFLRCLFCPIGALDYQSKPVNTETFHFGIVFYDIGTFPS